MSQAINNKNRGFSLIEVAIILVIVAVVASTALPKIQGGLKANTVSVAAMAGELDGAVKQARAQWFSNGQSGVARITNFADGQVWSGKRGWPIGHSGDEPSPTLSATACADVWNGVMERGDVPRASVDSSSPWKAQASNRGVCQYVAQLGERQHTISYNTRSGKVSYQ